MPNHLIGDTNIFYDVGLGKLDMKTVLNREEVLHYSPLSALEIAGKLSDLSHSRRKAAAQAILDTKAMQLPDTESFLTTLWGLDLAEQLFDWSHVIKAVAQSGDMNQLQSGVEDIWDGVRRTLMPTVAGGWRETTEQKWVDDMLQIMKNEVPGFARWYDPDPAKRKGRVPTLRGKDRDAFLTKTVTREWMTSCIVAMQSRAFLAADRTKPFAPNAATVKTIVAAMGSCGCFSAVYTQYLIRLLTGRALPERNDSGDIDLFCYSISDEWIILTREKKWQRLAQAAGFPQRVRLV